MKIKALISGLLFSIVACVASLNIKLVNVFAETNSYTDVNSTENVGSCTSDGQSVTAYSDAPSAEKYDTFLEAYYANLTENFSFNYLGTCGYVALASMLAYYDTYLSDEIVSENLDVESTGIETNMNIRQNSPGTLNDKDCLKPDAILTGTENEYIQRNSKYFSDALNNQDKSLQAKLIVLGEDVFKKYEKGKDYFKDEQEYMQYLTSPGTTTQSDLMKICRAYLSSANYTESVDYSLNAKWYDEINDTTSGLVKDYIKNQIDNGKPVLTLINNGKNTGGHFAIAYAYDDENVYFHSGWHSGSTRRSNDDLGYKYFVNAMVINFNISHSHSNNYFVGSTSYCYCSRSIISYKHIHIYNESLTNSDEQYHTAYCDCGESIQESHAYNERYAKYNSNYHLAFCKCGAFAESIHVFVPKTLNSLNRILNVGDCAEPCGPPSIGSTLVECVYCHYTRLSTDDDIIAVPFPTKHEDSESE